MKQIKQLMKNTLIYAIGNFGTKVLSLLIIPLYSYNIAPKELGYYDLVITIISLLQPILTFQLADGVYRMLVGSDSVQQDEYIASTLKLLFKGLIFIIIFGSIIVNIFNVPLSLYIILLLIINCILPVLQQIIRGLSLNKLYALTGFLNSSIMLIINAIGIAYLHYGIEVLLISQILSGVFCCCLILKSKPRIVKCMFNKSAIAIQNELVHYSWPLIPNAICWWIFNSSSRIIISLFIGLSANGIFAMASKFPSIMQSITSLFQLAWQESAIKEYHSKNRDDFFSLIFYNYYKILFCVTICLIPATRILTELILSNSYKNVWIFTGFLFLSSVFNALSSFLGTGYIIAKETKKIFSTTIISANINLVFNLIFVGIIGIQSASLASFLAYFILFFLRIKDCKKYFRLNVQWKTFNCLLILNLTMNMLILKVNIYICFLLFAIACLISIVFNKKLIVQTVRCIVSAKY